MNRRDFLKLTSLGALIAALPEAIANQPYIIEIVDMRIDWSCAKMTTTVSELDMETDQYVMSVNIEGDIEEYTICIDQNGNEYTVKELKKLGV